MEVLTGDDARFIGSTGLWTAEPFVDRISGIRTDGTVDLVAGSHSGLGQSFRYTGTVRALSSWSIWWGVPSYSVVNIPPWKDIQNGPGGGSPDPLTFDPMTDVTFSCWMQYIPAGTPASYSILLRLALLYADGTQVFWQNGYGPIPGVGAWNKVEWVTTGAVGPYNSAGAGAVGIAVNIQAIHGGHVLDLQDGDVWLISDCSLTIPSSVGSGIIIGKIRL